MNPMVLSTSVLLPIAIAVIAVILALTCRYDPMTSAVIIPDETKEPDEPAEASASLSSDLDSLHKLLVTMGVAVAIVLGMSLFLWLATKALHWQIKISWEPLVRLFSKFDSLGSNLPIALLVAVVLISQAFIVGRSFIWMTAKRGILMSLMLVGIFLAWLQIDSWITLNLLSAVVCVLAVLVFQPRISFLRLFVILLTIAALYDAWQVFGTQRMEEYARAMTPTVGAAERVLTYPALFLLPGELSWSPRGFGMLGIGDVAVLGVIAIAAARLGKRIGSLVPLVLSLIGFAAAMVICNLVGWYFRSGQPATIYIVPITMIPVILFVKWRGESGQLSLPFYAPAVRQPKRT